MTHSKNIVTPPDLRAIPAIFALGEVVVHPSRNLIESSAGECRVPAKVMQVLAVLREHAGESVPREYLLDQVWGEGRGSDELLNNAVSKLRQALDAGGKGFDPIETVPKFGYRLAVTPNSLQSRRTLPWILSTGAVLVVSALLYLLTQTAPGPETFLPTPHQFKLTQLAGLETSPSFSPDGGKLLFLQIKHGTTHNNLFIQNQESGRVVQLTDDRKPKGFPAWSRDGAAIAYVSQSREGCEIVVINISKPIAPRSRPCGTDAVGALAWHPDGNRIVLTAFEKGRPTPRLMSLDVASGDVVAYEGNDPSGFIAFSNSGNHAVWLRMAEQGQTLVRQALSSARRSEIPLPFNQAVLVEWGFDEATVFVLRSPRPNLHEIWRINLDSGEPPTLLTSLDANVDRFTVNQASRSLAYDHYTARQQIMLLDLASGVIDRSLESSGRDMQPVARPNHDSMSFRSNRTGKEAIWEVAYSADRGPQKLFETEGIIAGHDWSPDGREIVFSTRKPGGRFVITVRGQDIGRETMLGGDSDADALFPSFAGSSRYVLYTEQNDDGRRRSVQFDRLTGERREVLDQNAILARRGPSGSIFFTRSEARGIWLIRPEVAEPVLVSDALAPRDWGKWSISPDGTTLAYFIHDASRIFVETFELSTESRQRFEIRNYLMGGGPNLAFLNSELIAMATDDDYTGDIEAVQLSPQADNFAHLGENASN